MKHDYEKIGSLLDQSDIPAHLYVDEITEVVKGYSEYMNRWRAMDEVPEIGSRIEVVYQCKADWVSNWSAVDNFDGEFDRYEDDNDMIGQPYAWRPVGELPEVSDVA